MGSHGAFRALVTAVSLQSGICSFVGALLPHSKGGMHVCAQMLQQTFAFASCFSIFLPFLTTTENTACVFPFPQPTEVLDSMKNTSIHCTPQGQGQTDVKKKKKKELKSQQPCCNVSGKLQCLAPWAASAPKGDGRRLPERMRWCFERRSSHLVWVSPVLEQPQHNCGGGGCSNWFQTLKPWESSLFGSISRVSVWDQSRVKEGVEKDSAWKSLSTSFMR